MKHCTIIVKDEVNVKIEGLELDVRRRLVNTFKYDVPYARYLPAVRLGRWDGKVAYFQLGGSTYVNLLPEIIPILEDFNYDIELDDQRDYQTTFEFDSVTEDTFAHIVWPKGHPAAGEAVLLRDYQVEIINQFLANPQCLQEVATGAGKCQPLSSRVLTPAGWTTMGELLVGDTVMTPAGKKSKILNVFNPGTKDVYELTFADGRTARSCEDHIWPVYNIAWKKSKTGPWRNLSLKEIIQLRSRTKRSIGIPLVSMDHDDEDIDLPMDPWLMGFLLGDGSFRNGLINFSTGDLELVAKVRSKLDPDYTIKHLGNYDYAIKFASDTAGHAAHGQLMKNKPRNPQGHIISDGKFKSSANKYRQIINDLGLGETYSNTKFIPEVFFKGSLRQRLELIRGLTDSDGTVDKASVYFTSTSHDLAKGFQRLIRSVGGIAAISTKTDRTYVYNGIRKGCLDSYTVSTKFPRPWELMSLSRKQQKTNFSYQYGDTLKLNIVDIKKVSTEEVRCIYIDDPSHLYITDDYIVTHNTIMTAALSERVEQYGRSIVIVPNKSLVTQTEKDYRNMGLDVGVFFGDRKEFGHRHTICTWQSLNVLLKNTRDQRADITIQEFLEDVVCVIVDEVHMAKADALKTLLTGVMSQIPIRWGLTGTIPREAFEFQALHVSLGPVINRLAAVDLQEQGVLAQCHVNVVQLVDLVTHTNYQSELKYLLEEPGRLDTMAQLIQQVNQTGNTLVLVDRVAAGRELVTRLGDRAVFVSGATKARDRQDEYDEVAESTDKIIVATYGVAAVGINIPRIFNLVLIEPGKSFTRVIQSIGRGIRKAEDKDFVQIWDITSTCRFARRHLTKRKAYYREAEYPFTQEKLEWQA